MAFSEIWKKFGEFSLNSGIFKINEFGKYLGLSKSGLTHFFAFISCIGLWPEIITFLCKIIEPYRASQ